MTEEEWLEATDPGPMLRFLAKRASDRELRLFAVATCRRIWHLLTDEPSRNAVEVAERFADSALKKERKGRTTKKELKAAHRAAWAASEAGPNPHSPTRRFYADAARFTCDETPFVAAHNAAAWSAVAYHCSDAGGHDGNKQAEEERRQAILLRHIVGNPFRPAAPLSHVPSAVRDLAEAAYQQDKAAVGPLHDALLDAGLTELAEHFTEATEWHPKGCWAIDALTGRS